MDTCDVCKRKFPDGCCAPMLGTTSHRCICGVCALEERNRVHGLPPNTPFQGEMAQLTYENAARYLGLLPTEAER